MADCRRLVAVGILLLYSLIMGLYYGLFGWLIAFSRHATGDVRAPLFLAPFLWTAIDLLGAHLIKVPWDQLGYSQIDNAALTSDRAVDGDVRRHLCAAGGKYLVCGGRSMAEEILVDGGGRRLRCCWRRECFGIQRHHLPRRRPCCCRKPSVQQDNSWAGTQWDPKTGKYVDMWDVTTDRFVQWSERNCTPYIAGMPETNAPLVTPSRDDCEAERDRVAGGAFCTAGGRSAFPRADAAHDHDNRRGGDCGQCGGGCSRDACGSVQRGERLCSGWGRCWDATRRSTWCHGASTSRSKNFFSFAHGLTRNAGKFTHGWKRSVFRLNGHHYGIFICYESIFADEIRQFVVNGAEVLVNISDDGWYGDTSAPWQHLNMARMRAVENRRWLLRDTNTGVTAAIDPYGRVTQSAPRHEFTSLAVRVWVQRRR